MARTNTRSSLHRLPATSITRRMNTFSLTMYSFILPQSTATSYSFNKNTPPTADDDDCDGGDIGECEPSLGSNIQRLLESSLAHPHTLNGVTRKQGDKYYMR